jgi:trimeric autotransporter adhesin
MAIVWWTGNGQQIAQVVSLTVTAVATGGTLTATINGKSVTYTCTASDTTSTAAAAWQLLLANQAVVPPEFTEMTFTVSAAVILATANTAGTPFTMTSSDAGGATVSQSTMQANVSQSDVSNAANWSRAGSAHIPENGDDMIVGDSAVPLLWNLSALAAVTLNSYTRWQSFTGTIGLPVQNPNGYLEYRPTYFEFSGANTPTVAILGQGVVGGGPSRERYNVGSVQFSFVVINSGSPADTYAICLLGSNTSNTISAQTTSIGVATAPGETAALASAQVDGGGSIALGSGVTFSGNLTLINSSASISCAPGGTVYAQAGAQVVVNSTQLTYAEVEAIGGSYVLWLSDSTITSLILHTSSIFDKSQDLREITVTNSTIDGDTCQVNDPGNTIAWTNPTTINNVTNAGPYILGPGRTIQVV